MPAKSQAQRAYLNAKFGHAWVKRHGFDNRGKLPAKVGKGKAMKGYGKVTDADEGKVMKRPKMPKAKKAGGKMVFGKAVAHAKKCGKCK